MTEKLARRGLRVHAQYEADVLRSTLVRDVMTREVRTVLSSATVAEAMAAFERGQHGAYPLVDADGRCVGIVSRGDLLRAEAASDTPVAEVASSDVVTVRPGDLLFVALERMLAEGVEHLPVIEDGRLVGICTRTDVLRARQRQLEHERPQPGWRPSSRRAEGRW